MINKYDKYINECWLNNYNLKMSVRKQGNDLYFKIYIINKPPIDNYNDRLFEGLGYGLNLTPPLNFKCRTNKKGIF